MRRGQFGLRAKAMLGSSLPLAVAIVLCGIAIGSVRFLLGTIRAVDGSHNLIENALAIEVSSAETSAALSEYALTGAKSGLEAYREGEKRLAGLLGDAKHQSLNRVQQESLAQAEQNLGAWRKEFAEPAVALRGQTHERDDSASVVKFGALAVKSDEARYRARFRASMAAYRAESSSLLQAQLNEASTKADVAQKSLMVGIILLLVASLAKNYIMVGRTAKPLLEAANLAEAISRGDLTRRVVVHKSDEVGRLSTSLNKMADMLRNHSTRILDGVTVLTSSSGDISSSVSSLSTNISRSVAAVNQTAATVEEVRRAALISAEKAKEVAMRSDDAVRVSETGLKATEDTVGRMNVLREQMTAIRGTVMTLQEKTLEIKKIMTAVQDVAAQSNLLAVNASIEAARAGDQGKGFGVVADEIKGLADRSRTATSEAARILEEIGQAVSGVVVATEEGSVAAESGLEQAVRTGESIRELAATVRASSEAANVIGASSGQQVVGVAQVSDAIKDIETAMSQNIGSTSQLEESVHQLADLGTQLKELTDRYHV
ncbi:MAG: methyl-accepting chemotaxis protein [Desulfomonile tiedjei]|nr:methyl-accepting chemotaxis protein [Desulfomonile tiedjei]